MPDRYGDDAEPDGGATRFDPADAYAIAECGLCDDHGVRGMHACDHVDHAAAARRGMDMIRAAMGWTA